jgi:4-carboxymuconolactone decarboxylase
MASLPLVGPDSSPEAAAAFKGIEASRGYVSNLMRCLLHSPDGAKAWAACGHYMRFGTELSELQRELVICATVRSVAYAWAHHGGLLRKLGLSDLQMNTLKDGRVPEGLNEPERVLVAYVFAFAACKGLGDAELAGMRQHFSERQLLDASLLSAYFLSGGALITAFNPPIEPPEILAVEKEWQDRRPR